MEITITNAEPSVTDLDYYAKPENYTGSNFQALQRFKVAKDKEGKDGNKDKKTRVVKDEKYYFFNRYKHILKDQIFVNDLLDGEQEPCSDEDLEDEGHGDNKDGVTGTITRTGRVTVDGLTLNVETTSDRDSVKVKKTDDHQQPRVTSSNTLRTTSHVKQTSSRTEGHDSPDREGHSPTLSKRKSHVSTKLKHDQLSKERSKMVREKFINLVNIVKAICRLNASARGNSKGRRSSCGGSLIQTFMDIANDANTEENMKNAGLSFDPNYFKAKTEISLSHETKQILCTMSYLRTPEQVQTAMFGLQSLRSYAEYPLHMQEKLAKVAWYEQVAPKRIIIRQGHFAENFYFMLAGNAVVTILLKNPKTGASSVKTATVMKKGMSFGELALLHHSKRTATVTSQDNVQLLSIGRDDFFDIFMASSGQDNMPDHIRYISNLDFMKDWPLRNLLDHPEHCLLHFYKRNNVIVSDSTNSDWLYIVKSGSCQVLKKLRGVKAYRSYRCRSKSDDISKTDAIVFVPKVDTGLRRRKGSGSVATTERHQVQSEQDEDETEQEEGKEKKFSKDGFSKRPPSKTAHFSTKSTFEKRKMYEPPVKNKPRKPEAVNKEVDPNAKPPPVFVQVENLNPRDVFGLDAVKFDEDIDHRQTSVSLISRGAECVMLSKAFYAKYANVFVKKRIRQSLRPYPDEAVFQDNLQIKEDWGMYKKVLINDITSQIKYHSFR